MSKVNWIEKWIIGQWHTREQLEIIKSFQSALLRRVRKLDTINERINFISDDYVKLSDVIKLVEGKK